MSILFLSLHFWYSNTVFRYRHMMWRVLDIDQSFCLHKGTFSFICLLIFFMFIVPAFKALIQIFGVKYFRTITHRRSYPLVTRNKVSGYVECSLKAKPVKRATFRLERYSVIYVFCHVCGL